MWTHQILGCASLTTTSTDDVVAGGVPKKLRDQGSGISSIGKFFMPFGTLTPTLDEIFKIF
jgi:hypothetical protein